MKCDSYGKSGEMCAADAMRCSLQNGCAILREQRERVKLHECLDAARSVIRLCETLTATR
jgi:hypothetical protein